MNYLLTTLLVLGLCVVGIVFFRNRIDKEDIDRKFKMDRNLHVALYILEMWFFFVLFNLFIEFNVFNYEEKFYFKRFVDFFLIYQISVLVLLKMINSLKIDAFLRNKYTAEMYLISIENKTYRSTRSKLNMNLVKILETSGVTTTKEAVESANNLNRIILSYDKGLLTEDEVMTYLGIFVTDLNFRMESLTFNWLDSFILNAVK